MGTKTPRRAGYSQKKKKSGNRIGRREQTTSEALGNTGSLETWRKGAVLVWKPRGTREERTESGQGYRGEENSALRNDPGDSQEARGALADPPRRARIRPAGKLWDGAPGLEDVPASGRSQVKT